MQDILDNAVKKHRKEATMADHYLARWWHKVLKGFRERPLSHRETLAKATTAAEVNAVLAHLDSVPASADTRRKVKRAAARKLAAMA